MIDYQWPSSLFKEISSDKNIQYLIQRIEDFFEDKFSYPCVLMPSGRAGLGAIFDYLKITRKDLSFVPRWSSHCIYNSIGAYSSITDSFKSNPTIALAVHKWGFIYHCPENYTNLVIEDSSDSIHLSGNSFFQNNNSNFEVISLPKIMGVVTGGVVVSKNNDFKDFVVKNRKKDLQFSLNQSELKWNIQSELQVWDSLEYKNKNIEYNDLSNIYLNLDKFEKNKKVINQRYEIVSKKLNIDYSFKNRLGPVLPIDKKLFSADTDNRVMVRNFNFSTSLDDKKYRESFIIPLHIGIDDDTFNHILSGVKRI
jgi:putative PLP-dependent aminotransferase (TIGR04422 family)